MLYNEYCVYCPFFTYDNIRDRYLCGITGDIITGDDEVCHATPFDPEDLKKE